MGWFSALGKDAEKVSRFQFGYEFVNYISNAEAESRAARVTPLSTASASLALHLHIYPVRHHHLFSAFNRSLSLYQILPVSRTLALTNIEWEMRLAVNALA